MCDCSVSKWWLCCEIELLYTMAAMGSGEWKEDNQLEQDLRKYIAQNLKRSEVLDFVKQDFPQDIWNPQRMPSSLWYSLYKL